jgi:FtsP/CotA-like multicopper oxidase with cupredoxin domain
MSTHQFAPGRRAFLTAAARAGQAVGVTSMVRRSANLFVPGIALLQTRVAQAQTREALVQPSEIRSKNGVLEATLTAAPGTVRLGDFSFPGFLYNGSYLPPVLRARAGDVMRIRFSNRLQGDPSNLHFHGMSVSPKGNSDNVFVHVHPGEDFNYEVRIPAHERQGAGLFWYHPHAHGVVAKQILRGMSGGLVVDGVEKLFPMLQGMPERFLFIKHVERAERDIVSINGQIDPVVSIKPGEMQFWRIANIGATMFIKFRIEGMVLYVVANDGHPLSRARKVAEFFVGPGQRIDAIAIGPQAGQYLMHTVPFRPSAWELPEPAQSMATIVSAGPGAVEPGAENALLRQPARGARWIDVVRAAAISRRRTITYSRTPDRKIFMIDGRTMDENRVDQTVKLGDTEEWTVLNTDQQYHSFHIHQTPFLVTEVNGVRQDEDSLRDTFSVPPATGARPATLKVVIPFTDPVIVGRFVYHCHAVDHEDKGMMGIIEVVA